MKQKIIAGIGLLFFFLALILTSCLDLDDGREEYTAERELELLRVRLEGYVDQGLDVDTTDLGVYYVRLVEGSGEFPKEGDTISVKYAGYLMNGSVFSHSFDFLPDSAWTYAIGERENIPGWEEMMLLMNKGCKMEFVVPSNLAYGDNWNGFIPPYSSLIFVSIMNDVKLKAK